MTGTAVVFPVIDEGEGLIGGFNIDHVTHILHDPSTEIKTARDLMYTQIPVVQLEDNLEKANQLMNDSFMDEAVIIDASPEKRVIGIITSSDVVLTYNRKLSEMNYGDQSEKESDKNMDLADEMADVLWVLICLANQTEIDLTKALEKNFEKKGSTFEKIRYSLLRGFRAYHRTTAGIVKFVGGIYHHRDHIGDPKAGI